ncbi:uncharacterized protein ARMOST_14821 [Armillaria ostoyae]|uniref:Uncharacterized protein n=1 Tax=Armillaria ostoyae TaxID=47428 RepID=A0A284RRR9_ARMOS|nr:uncharacterized protein ARMOST_14821 [Armillaria ostoyae]
MPLPHIPRRHLKKSDD